MAIKGGLLRLLMITAYVIAFCFATIITGIFAWSVAIGWYPDEIIASLILGGLTMIYTAICVLVTCCTAGTFLAYLGIALDLVFIGAMMAVAILNRFVTDGCFLGGGRRRIPRYHGPDLACSLATTAFAVAIAAIFMFVITMICQFFIRRRSTRASTKSEVQRS